MGEELQVVATRLLKCAQGFQEMLLEARIEQRQLKDETDELNAQIVQVMKDVHRQEQAKTPLFQRAVSVVQETVQAVQATQKQNSSIWTGLQAQVTAKSKGLLARGVDF